MFHAYFFMHVKYCVDLEHSIVSIGAVMARIPAGSTDTRGHPKKNDGRWNALT